MAACCLVAFVLTVIAPKVFNIVCSSHSTCCIYTCCFCWLYSRCLLFFLSVFSLFWLDFSSLFLSAVFPLSFLFLSAVFILFLLAISEASCYIVCHLLAVFIGCLLPLFICYLHAVFIGLAVFVSRLFVFVGHSTHCFRRLFFLSLFHSRRLFLCSNSFSFLFNFVFLTDVSQSLVNI